MKNAVIIHGWGADSKSNWFPWLKTELEKQGIRISVPDFPNSQNPVLSEWLHYFEKNVQVDQNTILIGHSLGVSFILHLLEHLPPNKKIKAAFLVATFDRSLAIPEIENFVDKPFNWQKIKTLCKKFFVINSDNDPYIPIEIGENLAKNLDTKLIIEHNGEHLSNPDGMLGYPKLLEHILRSG